MTVSKVLRTLSVGTIIQEEGRKGSVTCSGVHLERVGLLYVIDSYYGIGLAQCTGLSVGVLERASL